MKPLETSKGKRSMRGRGKEDNTAQVGRTHILPVYRVVGTGLGTPPEENPKPYVVHVRHILVTLNQEGIVLTGFTIQAPAQLVPAFPFCPFTNFWKLEKRFGFRELPKRAQIQFHNARQTSEELLVDWADRVLSLATRAFRDLPETHMYQQAMVSLCQGTAAKETGPCIPLLSIH
jgi:hypothetical protein